jgi:hypothetical protein
MGRDAELENRFSKLGGLFVTPARDRVREPGGKGLT